jgi:anti-sigma-K factor RskA
MTEHHWLTEHLVEYVTDQLTDDDRALVEAHLPQCAACQAEVDAIANDLRYLPMGAPPMAPRPGFRSRVLAAATGRPSAARQTPTWLVTGLAAATALAAGLAWQSQRTAAVLRGDLSAAEAELRAAHASAIALTDTLSIVRAAGKIVYTALAMPGQRGGVVLIDDPTTHRWQVVAHGLPQLARGQRYQFWFICEDGMARGVPIIPTAAGSAALTTDMPTTPPGKILGATITIESDGVPVPASGHGPKIATLML